ncbi:hypothetical protein TanjilG_05176 [Lupinus angustifolius]|uniref:X8 domain-containing protein n=1 Tax=Lupinus angustifolius TaxID=3871 RepID=A0A394DE28_LUPAN|nr:hypothetical protein TanjilG_05176 [Lupinus angustifolius]
MDAPKLVYSVLTIVACSIIFRSSIVGAIWCVARIDVIASALEPQLDYACGHGADCSGIQPGGICFYPNNIYNHASYAFNSYYVRMGGAPGSCYFGGTATIAFTYPSENGFDEIGLKCATYLPPLELLEDMEARVEVEVEETELGEVRVGVGEGDGEDNELEAVNVDEYLNIGNLAVNELGKRNKEVIEDKGRLLAGTYARAPIVLEKGEGCKVYDVEGKEYLDLCAGIVVNALDHDDSDWLKAVLDQAAILTHVSNVFNSLPHVELAKRLVTSSLVDRVFFSNPGIEANETVNYIL